MGCGGSAPKSATPKALMGLDVTLGPNVVVSGEGARRNPDFGPSVIGAVESRLMSDGFDVVPASKGTAPVHIQLTANPGGSKQRRGLVSLLDEGTWCAPRSCARALQSRGA